jgi:hypothetical protein
LSGSDPRKREFIVEWNGHAWKGTCPQEPYIYSLSKRSPATALWGIKTSVNEVLTQEIMYEGTP